MLGKIAMASFPAMEGLRPICDAHWQSTGESGAAVIDSPGSRAMAAVRSGALERSHDASTEDMLLLIASTRNFPANSKANEGASTRTPTFLNMNWRPPRIRNRFAQGS